MRKRFFADTNINITSEGKRHLDWCTQLNLLSDIAIFYPQAAYCAYTSGFKHKFNYAIRTIPNIKHLLQPIEDIIRHKFLPSICDNRICSDDDRLLLSLPVRLGGLGINNITSTADFEFEFSNEVTKILQQNIKNQTVISVTNPEHTSQKINKLKTQKEKQSKQLLNQLRKK